MASKKTEKRKAQKAGKLPINVRGQRDPFTNSPATRERIKTGAILNRLEQFVLNGRAMAPHAVSAALGLLKKTMPDLVATHGTEGKEKTFEEWVDELTREGKLGQDFE